MAKDVNIHVKAKGAQQTKQQLDSVSKSTEGVGEKAKKGAAGVDKLSGSASKAKSSFGSFFSGLKSWATGLIGITAVIAGITKAINIQKQALQEHARIAEEQQKKLLALQTMGDIFEKRPELRKEIAAYAKFGRRPIPEVTEALYALESKGAGLTEQQKKGIMREALELGRMEPEAELKSIVDVFSLYAKETRQQNINQVQNVIRQTLSQAGAELGQMGQYLPQFLSLGISGGLTGAETAGLWAFATTRAPSPEKATTGIRNIFMALQGKGTPESQKLLQQLGITPQMNIFQQLGTLSAAQRAGKFGLPEAETVAMKENAALLMSMLTEPKAMMETVRKITGVARPDIDITRDKLKLIMGADEVARLEEEGRRLGISIEDIKGRDINALRWNTFIGLREEAMRDADLSEVAIAIELARLRFISAVGLKTEYPEEHFVSKIQQGLWGEPLRPTNIIINDNHIEYNPRIGYEKQRVTD